MEPAQSQLLPALTTEEYASLKLDIQSRGVQVPVEYDEDGNILDGHHRVQICTELGISDWPRIVRLNMGEQDKIEHILALNLDRRHLSREQRQELVVSLRERGWSTRRIAEKLGVSHMTAQRDAESGVTNVTPDTVTGSDGKSYPAQRTPAISLFNPSTRDIVKAKTVVESGDAELIAKMDDTGKVDAAYREMKRKQDEERVLGLAPIQGKYRTILIDPPWDHEGFSLAGRGAPMYAVMGQDELLALPVADWAEDECHLYLWTTNNFWPRALAIMEAWGFAYKTVITWVKPRFGLGSYFRSSTEHCLFGLKGKLGTRVADIATHFESPLGEHSEKPEAMYQICERASYPPRLEVFARKERDGWESSGI